MQAVCHGVEVPATGTDCGKWMGARNLVGNNCRSVQKLRWAIETERGAEADERIACRISPRPGKRFFLPDVRMGPGMQPIGVKKSTQSV